ncbi:hypothetical protein F5Y05DRAFT_415708 [Hypoxylon sp. FL0543]|nr:hypothetical protein F5Y05DRAFT_415708 [Hypoxylon sp. FL0543]
MINGQGFLASFDVLVQFTPRMTPYLGPPKITVHLNRCNPADNGFPGSTWISWSSEVNHAFAEYIELDIALGLTLVLARYAVANRYRMRRNRGKNSYDLADSVTYDHRRMPS